MVDLKYEFRHGQLQPFTCLIILMDNIKSFTLNFVKSTNFISMFSEMQNISLLFVKLGKKISLFSPHNIWLIFVNYLFEIAH